MADSPATVQLVCIRAFGTYQAGDDAGEVPADARYDTYYFAPADGSDPVFTDARASHIAELEAELAALEGGDN